MAAGDSPSPEPPGEALDPIGRWRRVSKEKEIESH
jgi:hypothetical protein